MIGSNFWVNFHSSEIVVNSSKIGPAMSVMSFSEIEWIRFFTHKFCPLVFIEFMLVQIWSKRNQSGLKIWPQNSPFVVFCISVYRYFWLLHEDTDFCRQLIINWNWSRWVKLDLRSLIAFVFYQIMSLDFLFPLSV